MYFSTEQVEKLNQGTRDLERRTGVQIVAAVVDKSDAYPEIPWKAFALGSVSSALVLWLGQMLQPRPVPPLAQLAPVLAVGVSAALATVFWPAFARLFMGRARGAGEVDQYARALFLEREVFNTPDRTGILLLVSLFERRVIILADSGFGDRLEVSALQTVIDRIIGLLKRGERFAALVEGLSQLEALLIAAGFSTEERAENHLPDNLIQRREERP